MKKIIDILSILGLVAAPVAIGLVYSQTYAPPAAEAKEARIQKNFPLNQTRVINFAPDEGFQRLSDRQKLDQLRDWLLFTVISGNELSAAEVNKSLYDLPPVRYGYMNPVSNFEYGTTRSLYIGNNKIVALVPKGISPKERIDNLAHIADRHRKDLNKQPKFIEVYEYEIIPDKQSALLIRREVLDGEKLFSSDYGYYETQIQSLDDLQQFMNLVDDVTFVEEENSRLRLGGRKIASRKYQSIRVEEVAAIWQSEKKIERQLADFQLRWERKLTGQLPSQQETTFKQALAERYRLGLVNGSGFSLDPQSDYRGLEKSLAAAEPALRTLKAGEKQAVSNSEIQEIKQALAKNDVIPYLTLLERLKREPRLQLGAVGSPQDINNFIASERTTSYQTARYDGDLQGTEVGMVLFYTDLLAKLWALNYLEATPDKVISDFNPLTKIQISSIYKQEIEDLPSTRLWFGPQDRGFQMADGGSSLLFARNATRIYAASSNPLKPGAETAAAANSDAFLGWWNDHYEEVARHEPQYERLNQIMKWSLVISWLNQSNRGDRLDFLQEVSVERDNWFPNWVRKQGDRLKFKQWERIGFFDRRYKGTKTEAMPLLKSESYKRFSQVRYISGGVSLADKSIFKGRSPLSTGQIGELGLRSNLNYSSIASNQGTITLKTLEETTYSLKNLNGNVSQTTAQAKTAAKLRSPDAQVANQVVSRNVSRTPSGIKIDTAIADTELGTFSVNKTGNSFTVGFFGRDIDTGHSLGLRLSRAKKPIESALQEIDDVQVVMKSRTPPPSYIVKMHDSKRWLKIAESGGGGSQPPSKTPGLPGGGGSQPPKPPKDWQLLVGDLGDDSRNFRLSWIDDDNQVKRLLDSGEFENVGSRPFEAGDSEFGDDVENLRYEQAAKKLSNDPVKFLTAKEVYFKYKQKRIDDLLKAKQYDKAAQEIESLLPFYGSQPELRLRKAMVAIHQARLKVRLVGSNDLGGNLSPIKLNFFDEINNLLRNPHVIETDTAFFYVQDHPGLNNLDWNVPIGQSVPSASGARVYQVLPGDIGTVKLYLSGLGDTTASAHASTQYQGNPANALRYRLNRNDDECQNQNDDSKDTSCPEEKPVYFVVMPDQA